MLSRTVALPAGPCSPELLCSVQEGERAPDFALAFLPPDEHLTATLATLTAVWPDTSLAGCEAVTQFADDALTSAGSLQLFWFESPGSRVETRVIAAGPASDEAGAEIAALAADAARADGVLLLADGLSFPTETFLDALRRLLPADAAAPALAGGLASQQEPVTRPGARVFLGRDILPSSCLAVLLHGIAVHVEVVRGWDSASPVYRATRAKGNVLYEIDGEPATDWYRRFFTVDGRLAPLPEAAYRFPLIIEGPAPERRGLYRSMRFFDSPPGAVTFWGSLEEGDQVRLGIGNDRSLIETAGHIPAEEPPEAAILYSCVGRQQVLGEEAGRETAAVHRALGNAALSGFFTFGEIGPTGSGRLAFYNHTAILVLLSEVRA